MSTRSPGSRTSRTSSCRRDFARALAEYWADGPKSETPPGHWNVIANEVSDTPGLALRIGGQGEPVDRLEWDVKLYLALNGAVHDAAIATWGSKGFYDSSRPISQIRYMGGKGQSSDPDGPVVRLRRVCRSCPASSRSSPRYRARRASATRGSPARRRDRHQRLARLPEGSRRRETSGVGWIRAVDWVPYQRSTFVTPAFAGYPSGHSTFSRAAAEVHDRLHRRCLLPGRSDELHRRPRASCSTRRDRRRTRRSSGRRTSTPPTRPGISRLFMGIHVPSDDVEGRKIGATCGKDAMALALRYFDGTAVP